MEWQPIETAPIKEFDKESWYRNTSPYLLLWLGGRTVIGSFSYTQKGKGLWQENGYNCNPTHWMPLPEAPK